MGRKKKINMENKRERARVKTRQGMHIAKKKSKKERRKERKKKKQRKKKKIK